MQHATYAGGDCQSPYASVPLSEEEMRGIAQHQHGIMVQEFFAVG